MMAREVNEDQEEASSRKGSEFRKCVSISLYIICVGVPRFREFATLFDFRVLTSLMGNGTINKTVKVNGTFKVNSVVKEDPALKAKASRKWL